MVNSAATTPSSFSSVLVLLILCCRVVTLRLQISGFPSVLCVVWVKQEQRGGDIFFGLGKEKKWRQSSQCIICHVLMTCMENKRRCRRSSLIAALFHDGLIWMNLWHFRRPQNSPTDFWASASSLCFDWNQHLLVLVLFLLDCLTVQDCESLLGRRGCFSWVHFTLKDHLKVSKHTPPFNSLFFFIQGF